MAESRREDASRSELIGPADDMLASVFGARGFEQGMGLRIDGDSLIKLVTGSLPDVGKGLRDGAGWIEFSDRERSIGIMDLRPHAAASLPVVKFGRVAQCMKRAMNN